MALNNSMTNLEYALEYLQRGYNIIPVGKDKKPLIYSWKSFQNEPAGEEQVKTWWTKEPNANIAAICGKHSNFFVVDVDLGADVSSLHLPPTKVVKTGSGGWHYYYKWHNSLANIPNTVGIIPHVDLRGEGSYILLPPSVNEKGTYELVIDQELADFPLSLLPPAKKTTGSWQTKLLEATAGSRNASAASVIGGLTRAIPPLYWENTIWPFVLWWNQTRSKPPLPEQELNKTFNSICSRSLQENWPSWVKPE